MVSNLGEIIFLICFKCRLNGTSSMPLKENTEYLRSLVPINYIHVKCHPWPRGNSIDKQRKRGFNKFELSVSRYERVAVTPVRGVVG